MPNRITSKLHFGRLGRRVIEADFTGGDLSSDGGLMLLRRIDSKIGLSAAVAKALGDPRDPDRITHPLRHLIAQRLYGICCGYEDLNDHDRLRDDLLMQTAVGSTAALASSPTLCRLERRATRADALALNEVLVQQFIASHDGRTPEQIVLDVDASDVPLHGNQEMKQFHGYYDHYCYLPLYVFAGDAMLACLLRPSRIDGARHAAALIKLLVQRLRQVWPHTHFIVRADSGFCRQRLIRWCQRSDVGYIIGLAKNERLKALVAHWHDQMKQDWQQSQVKQRRIEEFKYAAGSWDRPRRVITRLQYDSRGTNPRFVVTNLVGDAQPLYDELYCQRGEAENRIKEAQLDLFGTRASSQMFMANWFRLMLAALAYTLMQRLKVLALQGTELARATTATIRVRLLKIGAAVLRNTRRVRILLASNHPLRGTFARAVQALG